MRDRSGGRLTLERAGGGILHEYHRPVRAVRESFSVGHKDPVQNLSRFRRRPTAVEMVRVGELDRVGGGVEETVGRALEQRANVIRRIRRSGKRLDFRARKQNLDAVQRLLRRGADSVERDLRLSSAQVQQSHENLQARRVWKARRGGREKPLRSLVIVELQERNANVVVPGRSVGRQLTSALGVLERLVVPTGGVLTKAQIVESARVAGIEGDGLAIGGQRLA